MPVFDEKIQHIPAQPVFLLQSQKLFIFKNTSLDSLFDRKVGLGKCHSTDFMLRVLVHMPTLI